MTICSRMGIRIFCQMEQTGLRNMRRVAKKHLATVTLKSDFALAYTHRWTGSDLWSRGVLQKNRQVHSTQYGHGPPLRKWHQGNIQFKANGAPSVDEWVDIVWRWPTPRRLQGHIQPSGGTQRRGEGGDWSQWCSVSHQESLLLLQPLLILPHLLFLPAESVLHVLPLLLPHARDVLPAARLRSEKLALL